MTRPQTDYDDRESALEQANAALGEVFDTAYDSPKTSVVYADTEGERWFFVWEAHGSRWRFEVDLWEGTIWLVSKDISGDDDGEWMTVIDHGPN
jgi:hypothetical protein